MDQNHLNILNTEFNSFVQWFNTVYKCLDSDEDKKLAYSWANKLKSCGGKTAEDFKLRNRIFTQLVLQCQDRKLRPPFDRPPASGVKMEDIKEFFPDRDDQDQNQGHEEIKLPMLLEKSPDKGAFLLNQPLPKCGAFIYMAVTSHPSKQ